MVQKLFTLGPVEMYEYTRERLSEQLPYFRTVEFSEIVLDCAQRLRRLSGAAADSHVYLLTCSGTGAMEAVVGGCFGESDSLLAIDGGSFGHRFQELSDWHGIQCTPLVLEFDKTLEKGMLEKVAGPVSEKVSEMKSGSAPEKTGGGFTGMLVNLHETSTGQLYDKEYLGSFCRANGMYLACDAIGSFLADPVNMERDGFDALIISSQKALALPPGLSIVILADRLYQKITDQDIKPFSQYFDFREAEKNALRGQTPFTPAVGTVLALRDRLEALEKEGGADAAVLRTKALAEDFRARMGELRDKGLVSFPVFPLSNACTPLVFPSGGAGMVYKKLSHQGVWLNPNGGALADKVLRVGHLGNLTTDDNAMLAGLLEDILPHIP